jgi:hypothetical protein
MFRINNNDKIRLIIHNTMKKNYKIIIINASNKIQKKEKE